MAVLTTIDGIPLFTTSQEASSWASARGLSGTHTHDYLGTIGYMGGTDHSDAVAGNSSTSTGTTSTSSSSTSSTNNTGY